MSDLLTKEEFEKGKAILLKQKAEFLALKKKFDSIPPPTFIFTGLVKHYMDAVQHTNGLTSAKPSCTVALQTTEKNATEANLQNVLKVLQAHIDDAKKQAGSDAAKTKLAGAFKTEIEAIMAKVKKFATT
jgi:hypothetical protein